MPTGRQGWANPRRGAKPQTCSVPAGAGRGRQFSGRAAQQNHQAYPDGWPPNPPASQQNGILTRMWDQVGVGCGEGTFDEP